MVLEGSIQDGRKSWASLDSFTVGDQTSANNSPGCRYSKITQLSAFIRGQIPGQIGFNDSTRAIFEYP